MSVPHRPIRILVSRAMPEAPAGAQATRQRSEVPAHTPPIDIYEGPDGLVLEADVPGATEQSVTIQLEENVLNLQAEVAVSLPDESVLLHQEYRVGPFQRSFILSDEVERSRITAELENGVLRLTLPKAERAKTHRIQVKAPSS